MNSKSERMMLITIIGTSIVYFTYGVNAAGIIFGIGTIVAYLGGSR